MRARALIKSKKPHMAGGQKGLRIIQGFGKIEFPKKEIFSKLRRLGNIQAEASRVREVLRKPCKAKVKIRTPRRG